ncbi:MAG: ABC transporter ATP-binding protein [Mesorhizobium sp.]
MTQPRDTLISVEHLTKQYGGPRGVTALDDISLTVADGEFVSIVGPSGCGKSTLLKIMAGLLRHTKGRISLAGVPIRDPSTDVGVVFQAPVLLPWKTILENVLFPMEIRTGKPKQYRDRAMELLDMAGLKGFDGRYPHELSGGMQQRAAIVRALVQDPKLLLMDEPFGALDAMTREQMNMELLRIWSKYKKTVVFVTHSIPESVLLSDKVVAMTPRPGRIAEIIPIDLPRPRDLSVINTEAFGAYATRIRKLLNAKEDITG